MSETRGSIKVVHQKILAVEKEERDGIALRLQANYTRLDDLAWRILAELVSFKRDEMILRVGSLEIPEEVFFQRNSHISLNLPTRGRPVMGVTRQELVPINVRVQQSAYQERENLMKVLNIKRYNDANHRAWYELKRILGESDRVVFWAENTHGGWDKYTFIV